MGETISLGRFREEVKEFNSFQFDFDDPTFPLGITVNFNRIAVNLSASPYVSLANNEIVMSISHIGTINKSGRASYTLHCDSYALSHKSSEVVFYLKCA